MIKWHWWDRFKLIHPLRSYGCGNNHGTCGCRQRTLDLIKAWKFVEVTNPLGFKLYKDPRGRLFSLVHVYTQYHNCK